MKRYILKSAVIGLLATTAVVTSCSDDFLKPEVKSQYTTGNALIDKAGYEASLAQCASKIRDEYYGHMAPILAEYVFSDVAAMGSEGANIPVNLENDIRPDGDLNKDVQIRSFWDGWWKIISSVNYVIDAIDKDEKMIESERNEIAGTAYFYRCYAYYRLTLQFGDVPLVLEPISSPRLDFYSYSKTSILKKMMDDLKAHVADMPVNTDWGTPNQAAGYHLLAKLCLANADFDGAIDACNKVINDGTHHLMTSRFGALAACKTVGDPTFMGTVDKGFRALAVGADTPLDVIFDLHYFANKSIPDNKEALYTVIDRGDLSTEKSPEGAEGDIKTMRNYLPKWGDNGAGIVAPNGQRGTDDNLHKNQRVVVDGVFRYQIDDDGNGSQYRQIGRGIGSLRSSNLYNYDICTDPNDVRHKQPNWWRMKDLVYNNNRAGEYYGHNIVDTVINGVRENGLHNQLDTIRCFYPFPNKFIVPEVRDGQQHGWHSDWYVFRLAETYLLRAEAEWFKGDISAATNDVNTVHTRAGASPFATVDLDEIYNERGRELYGEEPRKCELARTSLSLALSGKAAPNGKTYTIANLSTENWFYDRIMATNNFYKYHLPNKGSDGGPGDKYTINPYHIFWPIPYETVEANRLGHINQTPGYEGSDTNVTPLEYSETKGE